MFIRIPAFSIAKRTGFVFASDKWTVPTNGVVLAWVLVPCSDAPHYYVPHGLVLANLKAKTLDGGQPWIIAAPKPSRAPNSKTVPEKRQIEDAEVSGDDAKRHRGPDELSGQLKMAEEPETVD